MALQQRYCHPPTASFLMDSIAHMWLTPETTESNDFLQVYYGKEQRNPDMNILFQAQPLVLLLLVGILHLAAQLISLKLQQQYMSMSMDRSTLLTVVTTE